jgi:hypothetical protein
MRAAILRNKALVFDHLPVPQAEAGELERLCAASTAATFTSPQTQNSLRMLFGDRMPRSA